MKALHLLVSEKKNFEVCLLCSYVQTCDPRGRASLIPGASYVQTSKLYGFQFQGKRILKMGFFVPMFQLVTPRWDQF